MAVRVWDVASGEEVTQLSGHSDRVYSVSFSPDGSRIVSGSSDRSMRVWDVASGEEVTQLSDHNGRVWSVSFSPDGERIVSSGLDRTVRVWDTPERVLWKAIARISRPAPILTPSERQRFGISDEIELPDQKILQPLMDEAQLLFGE